jgi:DNA mismatch endonuclease (patch repair protein)
MRANRREGGRAEEKLRELLRAEKLPFRTHASDVVGRPDLIFDRQRVAVFCDGDFWHGRDWRRLRTALARRSNAVYWLEKIASNRSRDRRQTRVLRSSGWLVLRIWEMDIMRSPESAAAHVSLQVRARGSKMK